MLLLEQQIASRPRVTCYGRMHSPVPGYKTMHGSCSELKYIMRMIWGPDLLVLVESCAMGVSLGNATLRR